MDLHTATLIPESELCRWAFTSYPTQEFLYRNLNLPSDSRILFEVPLTDLGEEVSLEGDCDVLAVDPARPDLSIGFQCKRVKVKSTTFQTHRVGKLHELARGAIQVGQLAKLGFHRIYFLVFMVVDGRQQHELNFAARGATAPLVHQLDDTIAQIGVPESAGISRIELTQPIDEPLGKAGGIAFKRLRAAEPRNQAPELTRAILRVLDHY